MQRWKNGLEARNKANSHLAMFCADKAIQNGWLASQTDMLSEDWIEYSFQEVD